VLITVQNTSDKLKDFSFTNSIFTVGERGMFGAGGGPLNCTHGAPDPSAILKNCFADAVFKNNLIIGGSVAWPPGNILVKSGNSAGLRDFHGGRGGDYRLCQKKDDGPDCKSPSPALGAGTDGKDAGANLEALQKATAGII
jgi:hypothetical protein